MENENGHSQFDEENYYSSNRDPLKDLAQDIIDETIFFREDNNILLPPLPSSIANDSDVLDIKTLNKK